MLNMHVSNVHVNVYLSCIYCGCVGVIKGTTSALNVVINAACNISMQYEYIERLDDWRWL